MGRAEQRKSKEGEYLAPKYCAVRTIVHWFVIPILLGDDGFSVPPGPPFCIYPINSGLPLSFRSRPDSQGNTVFLYPELVGIGTLFHVGSESFENGDWQRWM